MSVAQTERDISPLELSEWVAFGNIEPYGPERIELAIAIAAAHVIWAWGGKTKVADLMPNFEGPREQTEEEMQKLLGVYIDRVNEFYKK